MSGDTVPVGTPPLDTGPNVQAPTGGEQVAVDASSKTAPSIRTQIRSLPKALGPAIALIAGIYIYLVGLLAVWVILVAGAAGWSPVVITSGSMSPNLRVGDIIMTESHPDQLVGQRSVVTFQRADQIITHRVFEVQVEERTYITKGDANPTPDTDVVPADSVIGVGRLVVPIIGLPVVWLTTGQLVPLAAMAVLSAAAIFVTLRQSRTSGGGFRALLTDQSTVVADQAVRRVRLLIAIMIGSQFLIDGNRFTLEGIDLSPTRLMIVSLVWLGLTNMFSLRYPIERYGWKVAAVQLISDTVLVVLMTTATGGSGIGWVLTAVPIVEAAVRFRLAGALVHWMLMAVLAILGRLWILDRVDYTTADTIDELERILDQMSVLLLVVVPGAFLAEQLLGDVLIQRRAAANAENRGRLLENVAEVGHEVTKIGSALFETLTQSALDLGFDSVDVWARPSNGSWSRLASTADTEAARLPQPAAAGSGLRSLDLAYPEVLVDREDPELTERNALEAAGLGFLVRLTIDAGETLVVLRGAGISGRKMEPSAVEALRLLAGQARVAMHNKGLVGELQELHSQMEHQALHDALTGLPNRAAFIQQLEGQLAATSLGSLAPGRTSTVLFLDLNGFKPVNDRLGHDAGDQLLQVVSDRLATAVGTDGQVARLGGDEFTVLLPDSDNDLATEVANRIHDSFSELINLQQDSVRVGASIGVAHYEQDLEPDEVLRRADTAMYSAKAARGDRPLAFYHPDLDLEEQQRSQLAQDLRTALATDSLTLMFQPLVSVDQRRVTGAEVLLRWHHPTLGNQQPSDIFDIAESAGLIGELNRWILVMSLNEMARFPIGDRDFVLAVNASPAELDCDELIPNIRLALRTSGVDPAHLVIELSERIVASGSDLTNVVEQLIGMGVGLSLDDFGEGKTSLGHLRHLPIKQLKLDSLLVQQAVDSQTDRVILNSIVGLGHDLGFEVVAEGVETDDHMAAAIEAGADLVQGFGLYRPMPARDLSELIQPTTGPTDPAPPDRQPGGHDHSHNHTDNHNHRATSPESTLRRRSTDEPLADTAHEAADDAWPPIEAVDATSDARNDQLVTVERTTWPDR